MLIVSEPQNSKARHSSRQTEGTRLSFRVQENDRPCALVERDQAATFAGNERDVVAL
jgi:hypothetical protein